MFKFFKRRTTTTTKTTVVSDPIVCKIKIYNKAISTPIAEVSFKASERHLIGAFKASYPSNTYRVDVVNY